MNTLQFGEAETEMPDGWRSKVDRQGVTVAAPPNQNIALLWLSTLRWETPGQPGFNPADDFFNRADAPRPATKEDSGDFIIAHFIESDLQLETHTFRVLRQGFMMMAETSNGRRQWQWYSRDQNEFNELLNAAVLGKPPFPIEISHTVDKEWAAYRKLLRRVKP